MSRTYNAVPVFKLNAYTAALAALLGLQSIFVAPASMPLLWIGAGAILLGGQLVQIREALKERKSGGVAINDRELLVRGSAIPITKIERAHRTRSGLLVHAENQSVPISSFVYSARDLRMLEQIIAAEIR